MRRMSQSVPHPVPKWYRLNGVSALLLTYLLLTYYKHIENFKALFSLKTEQARDKFSKSRSCVARNGVRESVEAISPTQISIGALVMTINTR